VRGSAPGADGAPPPPLRNYLFSALVRTVRYFQFFFHHGQKPHGPIRSIIILATIWGFAPRKTHGVAGNRKSHAALALYWPYA
jgi:hypothetical protein